MERLDLLVVLGSQIVWDPEKQVWKGAEHTAMKAEAACIAWRRQIAERFLISGGSNLGVRIHPRKNFEPARFQLRGFGQSKMAGAI